MADSPGALLLRSGIIKPEQIAEALRVRGREGGSFGEALIRIGAVDEDKLVDFYHKRLMIPRLDPAKLDRIVPKVLALVPADMAAEFRVVPVELDTDGAVVLAMADPSDNHAVDEVSFFVDRFVVRAVASESAVRAAIEHVYGFALGGSSTARGSAIPTATFSAAPAASTAVAQDPSRATTKAKAAKVEKPTKEQLDEQIVLLTRVKRSEETPLPMPIPPPADYQPQYAPDPPILLTRPKERERRNTLPGLTMPVPDPPLAPLKAATTRDEIARLVLDYLAILTARAVLFVVKQDLLVGQDARGEDPNVVAEMGIDIAAPSVFRDVIASQLPYRGPLPDAPANRAFAKAVGGVSPEVLLMPIGVRNRIIAVVFADQARQPLPDAALLATIREAGAAYERLILAAKTRR